MTSVIPFFSKFDNVILILNYLVIMLSPPNIFGYQLDWFQDLQYLAIILSAVILLIRRKRWNQLSIFWVLGIAVGVIFLGYFGSRFMEVIEAIITKGEAAKEYGFWELMTTHGGHRWFGAILFNFVFFYLLYKFTQSIDILNFIDEITIAASGGLVIGKIGCWFAIHGCHGISTNLPWGVRLPQTYLPVHPTPIYDAIILFILFFVLIWLSNQRKYVGQVAAIFLLISSVANILVEIIRDNEAVIWKLSMAQVVYLFLLVCALIFLKYSSGQLKLFTQQKLLFGK